MSIIGKSVHRSRYEANVESDSERPIKYRRGPQGEVIAEGRKSEDEACVVCLYPERAVFPVLMLKSAKIYSVGRDINRVDFVLDHPTVSRKHAQIRYDERYRVFVKDLNSTNGVFIDGNRLDVGEWALLQPEQKLVFGVSDVIYRIPRPAS